MDLRRTSGSFKLRSSSQAVCGDSKVEGQWRQVLIFGQLHFFASNLWEYRWPLSLSTCHRLLISLLQDMISFSCSLYLLKAVKLTFGWLWGQCFPYTAELIDIWIHEDCGYTNDLHRFKSDKTPALQRGSGHKVPPLTHKLFATGAWQENQVSPMECHWVYQPHSRTDHMPRRS